MAGLAFLFSWLDKLLEKGYIILFLFLGSLQVLKSGEVVRVQPIPQGAASTSGASHAQPSKVQSKSS